MDKKVLENRQRYLERVAFYRGFGYDMEKEREFVLEAASPFSGRILEIGTGKGHFALALAKRGFHFTSIDISGEDQEMARLNLRYFGLEKKVNLELKDAKRSGFANGSFDVIFSVNVFHHLSEPLVVLDETVRLLRCGGKIIYSDFNEKGLKIINQCHEREGRRHDYFRNTLIQAKDYFQKEGFDVRQCHSDVQQVIIATSAAEGAP